MADDPTLAIPFPSGHLLRSSDHGAVTLRPATWAAYKAIAATVDAPESITRAALADAARETLAAPSPDALRRLFALTMMWGSGTSNGRGPRNTNTALRSLGLDSALAQSLDRLQDGDVGGAFLLHRKVPGVGPAFFTKWLWVVGTASGASPRPLILDSLVWTALGELGWDSRLAAGTRSWGARYVAYLTACERWAEAAGDRWTPEDIEYSLFVWGRGD
ncbi:8-oxoguanine DNA glycosylase OGG fold protein [Actinomarinicola tropica]|uniref:Uncharacterized protein n=1 Tax=Actinomarinicola tropica TaxID=2789776 RepID=A0A5Q2RBZ4_9ACTN|nr:hypothetical protein [Actinomarinicola tropica]QGG94358.1 hypothetical protein GH723_04150 [Actinomarinicola tropica]